MVILKLDNHGEGGTGRERRKRVSQMEVFFFIAAFLMLFVSWSLVRFTTWLIQYGKLVSPYVKYWTDVRSNNSTLLVAFNILTDVTVQKYQRGSLCVQTSIAVWTKYNNNSASAVWQNLCAICLRFSNVLFSTVHCLHLYWAASQIAESACSG